MQHLLCGTIAKTLISHTVWGAHHAGLRSTQGYAAHGAHDFYLYFGVHTRDDKLCEV